MIHAVALSNKIPNLALPEVAILELSVARFLLRAVATSSIPWSRQTAVTSRVKEGRERDRAPDWQARCSAVVTCCLATETLLFRNKVGNNRSISLYSTFFPVTALPVGPLARGLPELQN
jgi:hypothetical protein